MLRDLEGKLDSLSYLIEERSVEREAVDESSSIVKGSIKFVNGWVIEFREFKSPDKHDYRFHLMDEAKEMLRRWDSAPHHNVDTFPFHVHVAGKGVQPSEELDFLDALDKVEDLILDEIE